MSRTSKPRKSRYAPPENGKAILEAMQEKGLDQEIALLRVKLENYVRQDQADIGLILAVVNTLGRALLTQAHVAGDDPEAAGRLREVMRQWGAYLQLDGGDEAPVGAGFKPARPGRRRPQPTPLGAGLRPARPRRRRPKPTPVGAGLRPARAERPESVVGEDPTVYREPDERSSRPESPRL